MRIFYDLHIHSCLSPCADDDMTPSNIVRMSALAGYSVIAVTDHNSCVNCRAVLTQTQNAGILALPAMELTTSEEAHILCLFSELGAAEDFSKMVYETIPNIANKADIFGNQYIMDENDSIVGEEGKLLITACGIGVYEIAKLTGEYGGVAIPAHIDRDSFSVLSNLGVIDTAMGFKTIELYGGFDGKEHEALRPDLALTKRVEDFAKMRVIVNSDAHRLEDMPDPGHYWELPKLPTAAEVVGLLRNAG